VACPQPTQGAPKKKEGKSVGCFLGLFFWSLFFWGGGRPLGPKTPGPDLFLYSFCRVFGLLTPINAQKHDLKKIEKKSVLDLCRYSCKKVSMRFFQKRFWWCF
jgi:hypothetical protein